MHCVQLSAWSSMNPPSLRHLDFNLLLDLDALLREGSVVGAAQALHVSAPAMSRRLARLREAMGDPLFVTAGRGLVATPRALALRERVQAAIEEVRGVFLPQVLDFSRLQRTLTLRANDGFAGVWATRLASAMAAEAPGVSLHFMARADKGMDALRSGLVDLDIGVAQAVEPEVLAAPLFEAALVGVVRENHPLLGNGMGLPVGAEDFVAWPHIATVGRGQAVGRIDTALQGLGLRRRVAIVAPGFQAALVMAATSDFVAAMPEPFARWAMLHHRLQVFALPVALPRVVVCQRWHARHQADPVHRWLRAHVLANCQPDAGPNAVVA
jgi:DNA-binding transcriptional LysR family regulator